MVGCHNPRVPDCIVGVSVERLRNFSVYMCAYFLDANVSMQPLTISMQIINNYDEKKNNYI